MNGGADSPTELRTTLSTSKRPGLSGPAAKQTVDVSHACVGIAGPLSVTRIGAGGWDRPPFEQRTGVKSVDIVNYRYYNNYSRRGGKRYGEGSSGQFHPAVQVD